MLGKLTIDKASMNISYFLYSIKIISDNQGKVSRKDFGRTMGEFIGVPSQKNGKENRTPYNKSKLPRYFGFITLFKDISGTSYLVLTQRGKKLAQIISDHGEQSEAAVRYYIGQKDQLTFTNMLMESVLFDHFGKNNCGAETSNTDVEPPKIVFKTVAMLGKATAAEIVYIMYGLNLGKFPNYDAALETVRGNREHYQFDYSEVLAEWELTNIANDCKIINIFTDPSIQLLLVERDEEHHLTYFKLNPGATQYYQNEILKVNPIYSPVQMSLYSEFPLAMEQWLDEAVLGRNSNPEFIYRVNYEETKDPDDFMRRIVAPAVASSYSNEQDDIFVIINNASTHEVIKCLGKFAQLSVRKIDIASEQHGFSEHPVEDSDIYSIITKLSYRAGVNLRKNEVVFPANFHMISLKSGVVDMSDNFDYTFKQCLVDVDKAKNTPEESVFPKRLSRTEKECPLNIILYGAPGTGKTYATAAYAISIIEKTPLQTVMVQDRYAVMKKYNSLVENQQIVFTAFHQSYGYEEFIQGLRPDTTSNNLTFKPIDGVFKVISDRAMRDSENKYVIIIDEINRANISKVFGELITLIEEDKRWGEVNALSVTLPSGELFSIPNNLFIIGTMNSADKSISLIDTALRRRFHFVEVTPDPNMISDPVLKEVLVRLNTGLYRELDSTDLLIGHAYFIGKKEEDLCEIMNTNIIPLLYEYFYDNRKKVEALLKEVIAGFHVKLDNSTFGRLRLVKGQ